MPFPRAAGPRKSLSCHVRANRVLLLLLFASVAALAQSSSRNPALIYQEAILEKQTSKRILALEQFASTETADPLRADAMELLVWNYKQIGNQPKAAAWAQKLIDTNPDNPVGLAVLADSARYHEGSTLDQNMANSLNLAQHGLKQIDYLKPPEGSSAREFSDMQSATRAWLNGAAGHDPNGTVQDLSLADWNRVMSVNVGGAFLMSRAFLPVMTSSGRQWQQL